MENPKEIFLSALKTIMKQNSDSSLLTKSKYDNLIEKVKGSKKKDKKTPQDYQRLFTYDVVVENGVERLITPAGTGRKYFVCIEEMFEIINSAHVALGHGNRARILRTLKKKYRNVSKSVVEIFLKSCSSCKTDKGSSKNENRNSRDSDSDSDDSIDQRVKNANATKKEDILVKWAPFYSNMRAVFCSLLNNEQFVDVTLACEKKSIKCHKVLLSACSPYFAELLTNNPCQHPIVLMKDVKFWQLQGVIDFIYNGEVRIPEDKLFTFLKVAEALQIQGLVDDEASSDSSDSSDDPGSSFSDDDTSSSDSSIDSNSSPTKKRNRRKRKRKDSVECPPTQRSAEINENPLNIASNQPSCSLTNQPVSKKPKQNSRVHLRDDSISKLQLQPILLGDPSECPEILKTSSDKAKTTESVVIKQVGGSASVNNSDSDTKNRRVNSVQMDNEGSSAEKKSSSVGPVIYINTDSEEETNDDVPNETNRF